MNEHGTLLTMHEECTRCQMLVARHRVIHEDGTESHLCCTCHIITGGCPADWHPECMDTWRTVMERADGSQRET